MTDGGREAERKMSSAARQGKAMRERENMELRCKHDQSAPNKTSSAHFQPQ